MGVDIEIRVGLKKEPPEWYINRVKNMVEQNSHVEGKLTNGFTDVENHEQYKMILGISSLTRYYGKGYERGPFLDIFSLLVFLMTAFSEYEPSLFYDGDSGETISQISAKELQELMKHFAEYGEEPYRGENLYGDKLDK